MNIEKILFNCVYLGNITCSKSLVLTVLLVLFDFTDIVDAEHKDVQACFS